LAEVRESLGSKPGKPERVDSEYERRGTAHVLLAFEPLKGRREMRVTEHRRKLEFADMMCYLAETVYPDADRIRLVVDNLNTTRQPPFTNSSPLSKRGTSLKGSSSFTPRRTDRG
jgi:hypothetical protein